MASNTQDDERPAATVKTMEIVVAAIIVAGGILVIVDSLRLGNRWASDGPQAGYFPFYIGVMLCIAGIFNLISALRDPFSRSFVTRGQGKQVGFNAILEAIIQRDDLDSQRAISPLRPAEDAIILDTSNLSPEAVAVRILHLAHERMASKQASI